MCEVHGGPEYSSVWHRSKLPPLFLYLSHASMALHFLWAKMRADRHHHTWKEKRSWDEAERAASFPLPVRANLLSQMLTDVSLWDRFLQAFACVSQKCLWCWLLRWITWTCTHFLHGHWLQEPRDCNSSPFWLLQCCCRGLTCTWQHTAWYATNLDFSTIEPSIFFYPQI